jgi:hypothetical protein
MSGGGDLTRFADDFVVNFQYRRDAEQFHKNLTDRFGKFGLELAEEKTRVMRFWPSLSAHSLSKKENGGFSCLGSGW